MPTAIMGMHPSEAEKGAPYYFGEITLLQWWRVRGQMDLYCIRCSLRYIANSSKQMLAMVSKA